MWLVQAACAVIWVTASVFLAIGVVYTIWRAVFSRVPTLAALPPVSVLKPLCGVDPGLFLNLASFLKQDYPEYEVIFCVESGQDPALRVLDQLAAKYPDRPFSLVLGSSEIGPNPKVANLHRAWPRAKYDTILCSDSNVRVEADYLRTLVPMLYRPGVGIVTAAVECVGAENFGAAVEEAMWNTFYMRWIYTARLVRYPFVLGKTMLFSRSVAARFGGLSAFAGHCAEDYMMGRGMAGLGLMVDATPQPVTQYVGTKSLCQVWSRSCRWLVLQKKTTPFLFAMTLWQLPIVVALCGAAATGKWSTSIYTFTNWFAADVAVLMITGSVPDIFAWFLVQAIMPLIWVNALCKQTLVWRGHKLRISRGGWLCPKENGHGR